jgi:DNA replicative helicase MCM subunit Mcm2 (Cdc46/Mcm family)
MRTRKKIKPIPNKTNELPASNDSNKEENEVKNEINFIEVVEQFELIASDILIQDNDAVYINLDALFNKYPKLFDLTITNFDIVKSAVSNIAQIAGNKKEVGVIPSSIDVKEVNEVLKTQLSTKHLYTVRGRIVSGTPLYQSIRLAYCKCDKCGYEFKSELHYLDHFRSLTCPNCNSSRITIDYDSSKLDTIRFIELSDSNPLNYDLLLRVILPNQLATKIRIGDEVMISGTIVYPRPNQKNLLKPVMVASGVKRLNENNNTNIEAVLSRFKDGMELRNAIIKSFAPNIIGLDDAKLLLILSLLGGSNLYNKNRSGAINVIMIGDPSIGKTELMLFAHRVSPGSIYVSANATSVGLTASVVKDEISNQWKLSLGVLPLSRIAVFIDELNALRNEVGLHINEALQNGVITIAKAGINTTIPVRASFIASTNPLKSQATLTDMVAIPTSTLTRTIPIVLSKRAFTLQDHSEIVRNMILPKPSLLDEGILQKIFQYYHDKEIPIPNEAAETVSKWLTTLMDKNGEHPLLTPRIAEYALKLSVAFAKLRGAGILSQSYVLQSDVEDAVALMNRIVKSWGLAMGYRTSKELDAAIIDVIRHQARLGVKCLTLEDIKLNLDDLGITIPDLPKRIEMLSQRGYLYQPRQGCYASVSE